MRMQTLGVQRDTQHTHAKEWQIISMACRRRRNVRPCVNLPLAGNIKRLRQVAEGAKLVFSQRPRNAVNVTTES